LVQIQKWVSGFEARGKGIGEGWVGWGKKTKTGMILGGNTGGELKRKRVQILGIQQQVKQDKVSVKKPEKKQKKPEKHSQEGDLPRGGGKCSAIRVERST